MKLNLLLLLFLLIACHHEQDESVHTEVLVIGEGTGATSAAIQAARSGAKTILVTPLPWLGGMLTSAGVSATDGNHKLPAGLWGEFRDSLRRHYGGADSMFTGWVSNTMFEPKVGDYIWKQIANKESNLEIKYDTKWTEIVEVKNGWKVETNNSSSSESIIANIIIDGTDLGDVAAAAGATFDVGMDSHHITNESMAPETANDIIQDLTYAAILNDYGKGTNKTINKPKGYDRSQFLCSCQQNCDDPNPEPRPHPCETMLNYGKLPNGKYMINWPIKGNDYYANIIEQTKAEREQTLAKAKNKTLQFIYYIQTELGYEHLGLAENEFPSEDGLPLMPYHREGRRIHGLTQLNANHILDPYNHNLYKTGVAVGDYPIDHHHYERPDAPEIDFPDVPSFNIPIGTLIPRGVDKLLIADKAISVTNIVNGASRLQPVIIQAGQAAGLMAATAIKEEISPSELDIRKLQSQLLKVRGYIMPFIDVDPDHPQFESIQKVGATGILKGKGIPYKWANQTWFYPDSTIRLKVFIENLKVYDPSIILNTQNDDWLSITDSHQILMTYLNASNDNLEANWTSKYELENYDPTRPIKRKELVVLLDELARVFDRSISLDGLWIEN